MSNSNSLTDAYPTETSHLQSETEEILRAHIPDTPTAPPPTLQRNLHLQFLVRNLTQGLPARYTSLDASQPWLLFWTLQSFSVLQVGLDPANKQRAIDTIMAFQHPDGGFGGGPGQEAHLLPTYASVCALAIVGRPGPGGGWDQIDREKLYTFFMSLKQPDGSFLVSHHAEVDVRGIYCLLAVSHLLNLLTPALLAGVPQFIASCQTYEGGFSCASQPYFSPSTPPQLAPSPRPPLGEAHGGYTFCALASWVMLQPFLSPISISLPNSQPNPNPSINRRTLLRWLAQMQGSESELGGFKGRTNKLVDGCYSWWVGGAFALFEALDDGELQPHKEDEHGDDEKSEGKGGAWDDVDDAFLNRTALQQYILYAGQHPAGGLRDKPPKTADSYHTLYCLAGLSSAQHRVSPSSTRRQAVYDAWKETATASGSGEEEERLRRESFAAALSWSEEEGASACVGGSGNRVNATHPLFNLTISHSDAMMAHFYGQTLPARGKSTGGTGK